MQIIRLPLEGTFNTRDIGGYVCAENKVIKWNKVLRSDCLSKLTEDDKSFLINKYHLKKVIDLRSQQELDMEPNAFCKDERINYMNIALADDLDPNKVMNISHFSDNFIRDFYVNLLEQKKEKIKKVLSEIADTNADESVLFHCAAGKDRTGVIAMLILGLCGVSRQDIATNYMQTAANLKYNKNFMGTIAKFSKMYAQVLGEDMMKKMVASNEENIEYTYDRLIEKYGSFRNYYIHIGISEEKIDLLVRNITETIQ